MTTELSDNPADREDELNQIIYREYYQAIECGDAPTPDQLIEKHPDFETQLKSFFTDLQRVTGQTTPATNQPGTEPTGLAETNLASGDLSNARFIRDYQLLEKLGEGGMGTVYLAIHTQLEKRVAIKVIKSDRQSNTSAIERFRKEIKAVGRLEHDHIVRALDAGKSDGLYYLVMEYIDGEDISKVLACCRTFSVGESCEIARQAALALDHAHESGLIHRDIKPSNLMLTATGHVKLLDLGLAQLNQPYRNGTALTVDGQVIGTLKYMAPEQLTDSKQVNATCDVYSLGLTLIEMLCGPLPHSKLCCPSAYTQLREIPTEVPEDLVETIRTMTMEDPQQRTQSAAAVAQQLSSWADGQDLKSLYARFRQQEAHSLTPPPPPSLTASSSTKRFSESDSLDTPHAGTSVVASRPLWKPALIAVATLITLLALGGWWKHGANETPPTGDRVITANEVATLDVLINPAAKRSSESQLTGLATELQSKTTHRISLGLNELPAGTFELELGDWTTDTPTPIELAAGQKRTLVVQPPDLLRTEFPVQFPELPEQAGAWARYSASISPAPASPQHATSYQVTLRCLQSEPSDEPGKELRWIQVEVGAEPEFSETAWLLIDADAYRLEQELVIRRGYLQARLPDNAAGIAAVAGDRSIVVPWDDTTDPLESLAEQWNFQWPAIRVSAPAVLALVFGATHPSVPREFSEMRSLLGASTRRETVRSTFNDGRGYVESFKISAEPEPEKDLPTSPHYTIERAADGTEIPFSFLHVEIHSPKLKLAFDRSRGGVRGVTEHADENDLAARVERLAKLTPAEPVDFTRAQLPNAPGQYAVYEGEVFRQDLPQKLTVTAKITSGILGAVNGNEGRWIEVSVRSGPQGGALTDESVALLIDESAYRETQDFVVLKGWYHVGGEVFDFHGGNLQPIEHLLAWLGQPTARERLPAHQVLTLLFDAKLPSSGVAQHLRAMIAASDAKANAPRPFKPKLFERAGKEPLQAIQTEFQSDPETGLQYTIHWCDGTPFGFAQVDLKLGRMFAVNTLLDRFGTTEEILPGSDGYLRAWASRHEATDQRLARLGVRSWKLRDGSFLVGRFASYFDNRVSITTNEDSEIELGIDWDQLTDADRLWILEHHPRNWGGQKGLLHGFSWEDRMLHIRVDSPDAPIVDVSYDDLSDADQIDFKREFERHKRSR